MIVLKAPSDQVLAALQVVSGIVQRRHTLPILQNVLRCARRADSVYDECETLRDTPLERLPVLLPVITDVIRLEVRPAAGLARERVRQTRRFFGAAKVNARNTP
jgi:hypothetical protein